MLIEYPYLQGYLFAALESAPDLFDRALRELGSEVADRRPDPNRFSIREIMAHLAEWEPIFLNRMRRICEEDQPVLEGYDEGALAVENEYSRTDPFEQLRLFRERRAEMISFLRSCHPEDWQRVGNRPEIGLITLEAMVVLVPLHDIYHLRQIAQWRQVN